MKNFYNIVPKPKIAEQLYNFAVSQPAPFGKEHGFNQIPKWQVPNSLVQQDDFLWPLIEKYHASSWIFYYKPWEHYKWHRDEVRTVGINLILNDAKHFVFFNDDDPKTFNTDMMINFESLEYQINTYHLINAGIQHCGYNFETPRYFFTVQFPKDLISYEKMVDELSYKNLLI
jgi:hypothetical protein